MTLEANACACLGEQAGTGGWKGSGWRAGWRVYARGTGAGAVARVGRQEGAWVLGLALCLVASLLAEAQRDIPGAPGPRLVSGCVGHGAGTTPGL